jgi:hypothetical protein
MNELKIPATKNSPDILLNPGGSIKIKGRSIHENIIDFFNPVIRWVEEYVEEPADFTSVDISLEYVNSASAKMIINFLQKISYIQFKHKKLVINWYYEEGDEDILERGEYFSTVVRIPFNFIMIA